MKDKVTVLDRLSISHGPLQRVSLEVPEKETIQIEGFFSILCRERGKIVPGSRREGKNIWTLTGREYLARLMSYSAYGISPNPDTPARNDRIRYIGFGKGTTPEVSSVSRLVDPVAYDTAGSFFLAELAIPSYPFQTSTGYGTAVRYSREFAETEISTSTTVVLTEAGLFTDGDPTNVDPFAPGTRQRGIGVAAVQAPAAYKTFEPLKKTTNFVLQAAWEVRF